MAKIFNTYNDMNLYVIERLALALDNTLERLLIELKNIIEEEVYGFESPSARPWGTDYDGSVGLTSGNRTGQFYESWQTNKAMLVGNMIEGEIGQSLGMMQQFMIGNRMVHEDADNLASIIESGQGYNFGQCNISRQYWDRFTSYTLLSLNNIFIEECTKVGLPLQKSWADITML